MRPFKSIVLSLASLILVACAPRPYVLDADAKYVQTLLSELPAVNRSGVTAVYCEDGSQASGLKRALSTKDIGERYRQEIIYPASEMLEIVGKEIIQRWFENNVEANIEKYVLCAEIKSLQHKVVVDTGYDWPRVTIKMRVFVVNSKLEYVFDELVEKQVIGDKIFLSRRKQMRESYNRAVFRAMLFAFDEAMQQLENTVLTR